MDTNPDSTKTNSGEDKPASTQTEDNTQGSKTFSQDEVNEIVRKRINEVNAKADEKVKQAVADALAEQERKAKLSKEQLATEEQKEKEAALAERERKVTLAERRVEATKILSEKNIPASFVEYVLDEDPDKMAAKIEALSGDWSKELKAAVKEAVSGNTPDDKSANNGFGKKTVTAGTYRGDGNTVI